jgi:hypothetical protein
MIRFCENLTLVEKRVLQLCDGIQSKECYSLVHEKYEAAYPVARLEIGHGKRNHMER